MSTLIAVPELLDSAATDLASIASTLTGPAVPEETSWASTVLTG
ncbi:hypothetical protein LAUMK4_04964 [Mycobacterium persicum]|uniref:PE family protein n=1 Tax=Mycobacterium persicum TaxID=1487726 RepID=A0AB38UZM4_9MYCO|nr:hypothetical protein LAUMK15_05264 [Mycobacterium persicum]VAZ86096.1 hypothetical protein LAUMK42_04939 [Mycobacterium persicum]VBA30110.1 hypothetical protein LAUMK4_04964 [Mycobacterium persicum]